MKLKDTRLLRQQCYIDGQWVDADDRCTMPVNNPATGGRSAPCRTWARPRRGARSRRRTRAWPAWREEAAKERGAILRKWFDLMMANQDDLAII